MRMPLRVVAIAVLVALPGGRAATHAGGPQEAPPRTVAPQAYATTATAILVDVVVRDRAGRPVTDLTAADFELAEDGVVQRLDTFTRVSRGGGIGVGVAWRSPDEAIVVDPRRRGQSGADGRGDTTEDATTALVYDHLSSESLRLAQRATLEYVPMSGESPARVGVFATGPGVRILQGYTTDRTAIRRAVDRIVPSGTSAEELRAERADELMAQRRDLRAQTESAAAGVVAGTGVALAQNASEMGRRENELRLVQTELNMLRTSEDMDRSHRGYDTSAALLTVVHSLAHLPGRKSIVFFSEGLPVTPVLAARLDAVIDAANRANVTTYAIDAHGLRAKSTLDAARKEVAAFAEERLAQVTSGSDRTDAPLTMAFERMEDTLRLDSRTGLARLASETGGFLIEGSNDLSAAFRRIDEDNRFHYLLTYSPTNVVFDGAFREIRVKVRRPGARVFARKGYRAVRGAPGYDSGGYDVPALALLDRAPLPNAFPVRAAAFSFPHPARPGLAPLLVHVRTDALRFAIDTARSTYSAQAAVVVRIRDGAGTEVQRLGQQYVLSGDAAEVNAAKRGEILFYRDPDLPPGVYTVEAVVFDALARQGSARILTLTVPDAGRDVAAMSSLVLVRQAEEVAEAPAAHSGAAPLYVGRTLLYPNLGEPIRKSAAGELPFYFALYGHSERASADVALLRNGQPLAEGPLALGARSGATLQHVGRLPIAGLPAGTYELRIRIDDAGRELSRAAFFTIED